MKVNSKIKVVVAVIAAFVLATPTASLAYTEKNNNVDEEGIWEVINADSETANVSVTMYMMMQPDYASSSGFRGAYQFWCDEGVFEYASGYTDTQALLQFFFRPDNANVVDVFNDYQIWLWEFNIEPGTYQFVEANGLNYVSILTQTLGSSNVMSTDAASKMEERKRINAERVVLNGGDTIRLYAMFGDDEWRLLDDTMDTLIEYAEQKEESFGYGRPVTDTKEEEVTTIEVEQETDGETIERTGDEQQIETNQVIEQEETQNPPVTQETEETKGFSPVFILVLGFIVFAFIYAFWKRKR